MRRPTKGQVKRLVRAMLKRTVIADMDAVERIVAGAEDFETMEAIIEAFE
jgi:hypothetical protein